MVRLWCKYHESIALSCTEAVLQIVGGGIRMLGIYFGHYFGPWHKWHRILSISADHINPSYDRNASLFSFLRPAGQCPMSERKS